MKYSYFRVTACLYNMKSSHHCTTQNSEAKKWSSLKRLSLREEREGGRESGGGAVGGIERPPRHHNFNSAAGSCVMFWMHFRKHECFWYLGVSVRTGADIPSAVTPESVEISLSPAPLSCLLPTRLQRQTQVTKTDPETFRPSVK